MLPVPEALRELLPGGGVRRGSTVAVSGGTSLLLALLAGASTAGSWCAVVGLPTFGAVAAAECGIDLARLALVPYPGVEWVTVTAALLDGFDMVAVRPPGEVAASVTRRLAARSRQRGAVLVSCGAWEGADLVLEATGGVWHGLAAGRGRLRRRELTVLARGRGAATRPRRTRLWFPAAPAAIWPCVASESSARAHLAQDPTAPAWDRRAASPGTAVPGEAVVSDDGGSAVRVLRSGGTGADGGSLVRVLGSGEAVTGAGAGPVGVGGGAAGAGGAVARGGVAGTGPVDVGGGVAGEEAV